jgi:PAS domain-containing protein
LANYYEPYFRQALNGEPFSHEHYSHDRHYVSHGTPLANDRGEVYAVLAMSYDITDRKHTEDALRKSEEKFRAFVSASSDMSYEMSADWREMRFLGGKDLSPRLKTRAEIGQTIIFPKPTSREFGQRSTARSQLAAI